MSALAKYDGHARYCPTCAKAEVGEGERCRPGASMFSQAIAEAEAKRAPNRLRRPGRR